MLLALNIGNTNVTFGGYDSAGQRVFASRFYSDSALSSDELVYKLVNMLALYHIQPRDVDAAILASVVPVLTSRMREALEKMTNAPLMEVGPGLKSGVRIRMDNPAQLGGELLCAAVGALQTHKPPLLVMNMDTAATLVAVDAEGSIVGGVIRKFGKSLILSGKDKKLFFEIVFTNFCDLPTYRPTTAGFQKLIY